jgi:hypothetical protein
MTISRNITEVFIVLASHKEEKSFIWEERGHGK